MRPGGAALLAISFPSSPHQKHPFFYLNLSQGYVFHHYSKFLRIHGNQQLSKLGLSGEKDRLDFSSRSDADIDAYQAITKESSKKASSNSLCIAYSLSSSPFTIGRRGMGQLEMDQFEKRVKIWCCGQNKESFLGGIVSSLPIFKETTLAGTYNFIHQWTKSPRHDLSYDFIGGTFSNGSIGLDWDGIMSSFTDLCIFQWWSSLRMTLGLDLLEPQMWTKLVLSPLAALVPDKDGLVLDEGMSVLGALALLFIVNSLFVCLLGILTIKPKSSNATLGNDVVGILMARFEALARDMKGYIDAMRRDMMSEMDALKSGVARMKAGVDRPCLSKPPQVQDNMISKKDLKGIPHENKRNELVASLAKSSKKCEKPRIDDMSVVLMVIHREMISVFLVIDVHVSPIVSSLDVYNESCAPKDSSLFDHEDSMIENFQVSVDAYNVGLDDEYYSLNLFDEDLDSSMLHSDHVHRNVVSDRICVVKGTSLSYRCPILSVCLSLKTSGLFVDFRLYPLLIDV
ncbi:hypothetical protein FXO37_21315 [Capsicum annuum]|nr:hypothetical protein FXO37_21315 [Capsicum annuum]